MKEINEKLAAYENEEEDYEDWDLDFRKVFNRMESYQKALKRISEGDESGICHSGELIARAALSEGGEG